MKATPTDTDLSPLEMAGTSTKESLQEVTSRSPHHQGDTEKTPSTGTQHEYMTGVKLILIISPITLVYFLVMLDDSIMSTAIPEITTEFDSLLDIGWYGCVYQLASSAFQPLSGKIYTYFNTKWSFFTFFTVFELGSAICGAAQSSTMLIVGRAICGLGSAGLVNGGLTVLSALMPPYKLPLVLGVNVGLGQVGLACGPLVGGALTEYASWRWCFYLNLPIGAVAAVALVAVSIPEISRKPHMREAFRSFFYVFDIPGFVLITMAATMFFLAIQYGGNQYPWSSSIVIGLFVGAGAAFLFFLTWEWRCDDQAMVPFNIVKKRIVWSASITLFFFMGVLLVGNYYLPLYMQVVKDDTALMSGVHTLPVILGQIVFAILSCAMVEKFGYYLPWVLGGSALTAVSYGLLSTLYTGTSRAHWVGFEFLFGAGCGAAFSGSFIAVQNFIPSSEIPTAMAILVFVQNFGGALWLTTAQSMFTNTLSEQVKLNIPGVNTQLVISAGARSIRQLFSGEDLSGILRAYSNSIDKVMYLGIALAMSAFLFAFGLGMKDIRVAKTLEKSQMKSSSEVSVLS